MNKFIFLLVYLESKSYSLLLYGLIIGITFSYSLILLSDISNLISLICGLLFIFITTVISWRTYSLYLLKTKISRKSINRAKLDLVKYNRQKKMTKLVLIKMNRSLKIIIFIFFNFMGYVYGQIDSVTYHMQELLPNRKVIRYPSLDKAARLHAEYMVTQKKTCHLQVENQEFYSVRERAYATCDKSDFGYSEVLWGGTPFLDKNIKESIYYFKESSAHWKILTQQSRPILNVKFGYARLTTSDYDVCVIVLTNFFYDDPDLFIPKPSYF